MILAVDVMGFENEINEAIKAVRCFHKTHDDTEFILVGDQNKIKPLLKKNENFKIHDATDIILMEDNPLIAMRKTNSSMYQAIDLVEKNKADAVLSAGSTSVYVPMVYSKLKMINGIQKPGFMPYLPTIDKKGFMMIDVGANKECSGHDLYNFAKMGSIYSRLVRNCKKPRVGIINIGTESYKGFKFHIDANELLSKDETIKYVGFVEPRELINGIVDVAVCDGYTGNIVLKSLEGAMKSMAKVLKTNYKKPQNWLGAFFSLGVIKQTIKTFDYKNNAGAIVLGLKKVAIKTHGSADYRQFYSSLEMMYKTVKSNVIEKINIEMEKNY